MAQRMQNKVALVTGGGSGIGPSICTRLASDGARVIVLDLILEAAQQTVEQIRENDCDAAAYACDVAKHEQVAGVFQDILAEDDINILINNAGIAHIGNVETTSEEDLDRLYGVNIKGVYNLVAAVIPSMKSRGSGIIVNVSSIASSIGLTDRFAYSMTKGAVRAMTYSIARDYIDFGIRCNCISPARVHTPFVDHFLADNYPDNRDEMFDRLSNSQPIGRMGTADEIAGLVAFLCSDDASFITGSDIPIDGGFLKLNT